MKVKPRIALIIGSTRPTRFADKPAQWMLKQAKARQDMDVEVVDLRDHPLPFFNEVASNLRVPSKDPEAIRWQQTVGPSATAALDELAWWAQATMAAREATA